MSHFIWPSDLDRAENDELNRVCDYLEEVLDERDAALDQKEALADIVEGAKALGFFEKSTDSGCSHKQLCDKVTIWQKTANPGPLLACRYLLQRADALDEARRDFERCYPVPDNYAVVQDVSEGFIKSAAKLRQQAKELVTQ